MIEVALLAGALVLIGLFCFQAAAEDLDRVRRIGYVGVITSSVWGTLLYLYVLGVV